MTGLGIVVLDVDNRYSFVKRIATWDVPASAWPEVVTGFAASPVTNMAYLATRGHLGALDYIRIFATAEGYRFLGSIKMTASPGWITMGLGGRYAYVSSGDVVDVRNWRVVTQLKDEFGRQLGSEKLLDMVFRAGKLQRVANQFGNGVAADREHWPQ